MITPPIRPGTARRLGLRPPPPQGVLICGHELTDEQMRQVKEACDRRIVYGPPFVNEPSALHPLARRGRRPVSVTPWEPRRRWWQRRSRVD